MYHQHRVAVVIPTCNEEPFIADTLRSIPMFVDKIIIVDDGSQDDTLAEIYRARHPKVSVIKHPTNRGVGAAVISGYRLAVSLGMEIVAVMDGDGQMNPADLPSLLDFIILNDVDYVKGNRFLHPSINTMPRMRYLGNRILSTLTRLALGIRIFLDAQCGYTAITGKALAMLEIERLYPSYGYLNDLLFYIVSKNLKLGCVPVHTIYGKEISGINPLKTVPVIFYLMLRGYLQRISRGIGQPITKRIGILRQRIIID